jgi:four helix bundle protein
MGKYNLEERTYQFAKKVRLFIKRVPLTISNKEDIKQLARASVSIGANYIEANEALGKKDFLMRLRISRKEAKESGYFIRLLYETNGPDLENDGTTLHQESIELRNILSAIINKSQ